MLRLLLVVWSMKSPESDRWGTPWEVFNALDKRFDFTVDVAADSSNYKLPHYYDETDDGLAQSWGGERVFCNPPYSQIEKWVTKAWIANWDHVPVVMLVPANRTDQPWWQRWIEPSRDSGNSLRVEFLPGRIHYLDPATGEPSKQRPMFGSCLLIWGFDA